MADKKPHLSTQVMIDLYQQGLSTTQIAHKLGLCKSSVGKRLKGAQISLRKSADYEGESRYWLWKGKDYLDPLTRKRNQLKHRKWSLAVRKRDEFKCKDCGVGDKVRLEAHHLVSLRECLNSELEFDINNGVTLCSPCHKRRHK